MITWPGSSRLGPRPNSFPESVAGIANGAAVEGPPRDVRRFGYHDGDRQSQTVADTAAFQGKRSASPVSVPVAADAVEPLGDLDYVPWPRSSAGRQLAAERLAADVRERRRVPVPARIEYGTYDVSTLGLNCSHGENCPARRGVAV